MEPTGPLLSGPQYLENQPRPHDVEGYLFHKSLSLEQGTDFDAETHPSENPLASAPEVAAAEPEQSDDGRPEVARLNDRVNGFIRSFP